MFDVKTLRRTQPTSQFVQATSQPVSPDDMTEDEYIVLPSVAYGYSFEDKFWGKFILYLASMHRVNKV